MAEEEFAVGGEFGFAFEAVEEAFTEFIFELLDLLTEGGLGDVALFRGAGEIGRAGEGDDVTELVHFHRQYLS